MPIVATSAVFSPLPLGAVGGGRAGEGPGVRALVSPLPVEGSADGRGAGGEGLRGHVLSPFSATLQGTLSRSLIESLSGPLIHYTFTVKLNGVEIPSTDLVGPLEIDDSIDTPAVLFSFTLIGRRWSIQSTATTWTSTPVEIWVTVGPIGALRTWRRAFGYVLSCEQQEGLEPTLRVKCGDPSRLYDRHDLCYEFPADAGLTRGQICHEILTDAGFTTDVPAGALYTKPLLTDSQRLWLFLAAFGEAEGWSWRLADDQLVQAYRVELREPPEPPDDIWTLRDVLSIDSAAPTDVPSQWVIRSTQITEAPTGITITKQRDEVFDFYAVKKAVAMQQADGTLQPIATASAETFQLVSVLETESHDQAGLTIAKITRQWGWYNPRAAKLRTPAAGEFPGPVEDGYHWAQAFLDEEGACRAWRQEAFVKTGERRELPTYDAEGTETARRIETFRWYSRLMAVRNVGSSIPNVVGAGIGDDTLSWYPFEVALTALLRIEDFGLAQVDQIQHEYGDTGAVTKEIQETSSWYSQRTAISEVPWFLNYSGSGQKDLVAPFQRVIRKTTANHLTEDGLLTGKTETTAGWIAPRRVAGAHDWGDSSSNLTEETWGTANLKTTAYNVLDESTYEELVDDGTGAVSRLVMGRAPRPRYRQSSWTRLTQTPFEIILEDPVVATWWGPSVEVLTLDYAQSPEEAAFIASRRRSRRLAFTHTVIRPICPTRPGDTILLLDPRSGIHHRCLVTRRTERWVFSPRPQILATYTLEQPL